MKMQELVNQVTEALGKQALPAAVLQKAGELMRDSLRNGDPVEFFSLARLHLTAAGLSGKATDETALVAQPLPGLLPHARTSGKSEDRVVVLAVVEEDPFSKIMARRLEIPGQKAVVAVGVEGVMQAITEYGASAVIMDSNMELADEIRLFLKSTPDRSMISLICLYAGGENPESVKSFRICEDEFLVEPYETETLHKQIDDEIRRMSAERRYFRHEVSFQFPAKPLYQQQAAGFLERIISFSGMSEEKQMALTVACREAIDNAIRHGNQSNPESAVTVAYVLDHEKITITVEDEGKGFDSTVYLQNRVSSDAVETARARHRQGRQGGLGIMLMLKSLDKLEYNRTGNRAKLTKMI